MRRGSRCRSRAPRIGWKAGLGRLENVRLGLVGRNLFTFTKYSGYDPEVSGIQGDPYQFRIDWFSYPHFRTFTGVVEIAF